MFPDQPSIHPIDLVLQTTPCSQNIGNAIHPQSTLHAAFLIPPVPSTQVWQSYLPSPTPLPIPSTHRTPPTPSTPTATPTRTRAPPMPAPSRTNGTLDPSARRAGPRTGITPRPRHLHVEARLADMSRAAGVRPASAVSVAVMSARSARLAFGAARTFGGGDGAGVTAVDAAVTLRVGPSESKTPRKTLFVPALQIQKGKSINSRPRRRERDKVC